MGENEQGKRFFPLFRCWRLGWERGEGRKKEKKLKIILSLLSLNALIVLIMLSSVTNLRGRVSSPLLDTSVSTTGHNNFSSCGKQSPERGEHDGKLLFLSRPAANNQDLSRQVSMKISISHIVYASLPFRTWFTFYFYNSIF